MINELKGTGVALVTPFKPDLTIDFAALEKIVSHVADNGVNYLVVNGTTGESATTTAQEKRQLLDFVLAHNPKKLPVVYGIGGNNTQQILDDIKAIDLTGVAAVLSVSPYYNKPTQEGLYRHYNAIADASPKPIVMYNVPGRTASNMEAATTLRLAKHPNIVAVKEAVHDMAQIMAIAKDKPDDFWLISGDDMLTLSMVALGGQGVISVMANALPGPFSTMVQLALNQELPKARGILHQLMQINPLMYKESNPVGVKQAMKELGLCEPHVRMPLLKASDELAHAIQLVLNENNWVN